MSILGPDELRRSLEDLDDDWDYQGDRLRRELSFDSFRDAIDFIVRVADLAEEANHHPELTNVYSNVTVELMSHDAGGVTDRDIALAREIDGVV
jgi:4a-hydroxytetrahydrobiopterin dehydratase